MGWFSRNRRTEGLQALVSRGGAQSENDVIRLHTLAVAHQYMHILLATLSRLHPEGTLAISAYNDDKRIPNKSLTPLIAYVSRTLNGKTVELGSFSFADDNAWGRGPVYVMAYFESPDLARARIEAQSSLDNPPDGLPAKTDICGDDAKAMAETYLTKYYPLVK